ncbi:MAG: cysteine desulfurase family protein [Myxococcota bacterium]
MIYLDHNATTPLHPAARDAMLPWLGPPANPTSAHAFGRAAAEAVDRARAQVAELCGWHREGVYFTAGATEANATVLSRGRWLVSAVEHPSVRVWGAGELPVDADGVVRLGEVDADAVSVMLANNETGVIQPVAEIARGRAFLLHVDATQAPGKIPVRLDADFVTLSAHKMGGPTGIGALLVRKGVAFEPLLRGGSQERGRRAGTHAVAAIVGFGAAASVAGTTSPTLRDRLEAGLVALGGRVAGAGAPRLPNTSCVGFEGVLAADLAIALDLAGVAVSAGAACASGSAERSHVLRAMGFPGTAVRFSLGPSTTEAEVDAALVAVRDALGRMRSVRP